jgi:predicted HTH domain antitoxin
MKLVNFFPIHNIPNPKPKNINSAQNLVFVYKNKMALISTRIPDDIEKELKWYAKKEKLGKTIALRKILEKGLHEIKLEHALDSYKKGKVTLMKAAELAGLSLWEILDIIREKRIPMHYALEDVEKDLEIAKKIK